MKYDVAHDLDLATAKRVVACAFADYAARFPSFRPTLRWVSERRAEIGFHAKGFALSGAIDIADRSVGLELDVPLLLRPLQKRALEVIEREVRRWLDKAKAGQLGDESGTHES